MNAKCFLVGLNLIWLSTAPAFCQQLKNETDSLFTICFISENNNNVISFAHIYVAGIKKWETNVDGIVKIKKSEITGAMSFTVQATGFETKNFENIFPQFGKLIILKIQSAAIRLDEIEILNYRVPMLYSTDPYLTRKQRRQLKKLEKAQPIPDTVIHYSPMELALYDSLLIGKYPCRYS
jgi:hypothetical protein